MGSGFVLGSVQSQTERIGTELQAESPENDLLQKIKVSVLRPPNITKTLKMQDYLSPVHMKVNEFHIWLEHCPILTVIRWRTAYITRPTSVQLTQTIEGTTGTGRDKARLMADGLHPQVNATITIHN